MRLSGELAQPPPSPSPLPPSLGRTPCTSSTRLNCSGTVAPDDRSRRLLPERDRYPIATALSVEKTLSTDFSPVHIEETQTQERKQFHCENEFYTREFGDY